MQDKTLTCRDCGNEFTFTSGEQEFYAQKGYSQPARCPDCRAVKKAARAANYGRERVMTQVICSNCGKETEVPFVPRDDRPVYCAECFDTMRNSGADRD